MCNERENFRNFKRVDTELTLANNESTRIMGTGDVRIMADVGKSDEEIIFKKVFYVPDLRTNLLSVARATDHGFEVKFCKDGAVVVDKDGHVTLRAERRGNLYYVIKSGNHVNMVEKQSVSKSEINIWHEKLGHLNEQDLKLMANRELVYGLNIKSDAKLSECEVCMREKLTRLPFPKTSENRTQDLLEIVYTDVCGPMRCPSVGGKKYFVTFIDDKSRWCEVYFVKSKSEILRIFKEYKQMVETSTGRKIKILQSDNGTEYCNNQFDEFLVNHGIRRRLTTAYTPQQNGVAERKNRTLVEMARCMMRQAGAPPSFWAEAILNANYTRNRCPTRALDGQIPYLLWRGKTPTVRYFQIFGTKVFALDKRQNKGKFDSRGQEGIFLGYSEESKAYRIYLPNKRETTISRDVKLTSTPGFKREYREIMEEIKTGDIEAGANNESEQEDIFRKSEKEASEEETEEEVERERVYERRRERKRPATCSWESLVQPSKRGRGRPKIIRTGSVGRPRKLYVSVSDSEDSDKYQRTTKNEEKEEDGEIDDDVFFEQANFIEMEDPMTWSEASNTADVNAWRCALEDEFLAQIKNNTWDIVERPDKRKVIKSRFVFCTKINGKNNVQRKKVRLVAKGCSQKPGEDFSETYSPVARLTSIRLISALAAELNLEIHQLDVVTAYLNGELEENVYMEVPEQLHEVINKIRAKEPFGSNNKSINDDKLKETVNSWYEKLNACSDSVCLLRKSLYGLRQSGVQWHKKLVNTLYTLGFKAMPQDPCMFVCEKKHKNKESLIYIAIYVDDMLLASNNIVWLSEIKKSLSQSFETKDLGKIDRCLGIEFTCDKNRVCLRQTQYVNKLLMRFNMSECKPVLTPMEINCKLSKPEYVNTKEMEIYPYQRLIGALLYLSVSTRPDIAYTVNYLSQFNSNYNSDHWKAAKRVLRYLKGTSDYGIEYEKTGLPLFGVVDADWASDAVDRRSYSGYAFILAGSVVSWEARKQRTVALSSTEAEYMALSEATKEAMYFQSLLRDLGVSIDNEQIVLFNDSQSAIKLVLNNSYHSRTKHIDVRHHFVREVYERELIDLKYLSTERMPADVLTKSLSNVKHRECLVNLGMVNVY